MRKLATLFSCVGFIIQYIVPLLLFGTVVPYTHDGVQKGLTVMGYIAVGILAYIISKKVKEWLLQKPKSFKRALALSVFPVVWWLIIFLCLGWTSSFMLTFSNYWDKVIIFIIIGRGFYILSETLYDMGEETK